MDLTNSDDCGWALAPGALVGQSHSDKIGAQNSETLFVQLAANTDQSATKMISQAIDAAPGSPDHFERELHLALAGGVGDHTEGGSAEIVAGVRAGCIDSAEVRSIAQVEALGAEQQ